MTLRKEIGNFGKGLVTLKLNVPSLQVVLRVRLGGGQQGGGHLHGDPLQDGGVHQRVGRPGTWTPHIRTIDYIISMKKL